MRKSRILKFNFVVSVCLFLAVVHAQPPPSVVPTAPTNVAPAMPVKPSNSVPTIVSPTDPNAPKIGFPEVLKPTSTKPGQEIFVDVGRADSKRTRIAIPGFVATNKLTGATLDNLAEYTKRLDTLLSYPGVFDSIPKEGFLSSVDSPLRPINYMEWSSINSEYVIFGKMDQAAGNTSTLELRLFDIKKQKMVLGKKYSGISASETDAALRRYADLVMQYVTGKLGFFNTKLVFAAARKKGDVKQIFTSNFDGSNIQAITNDSFISMSPAWSPDGSKIAFTSFKSGRADVYLYNRILKRTDRLTKGNGGNSGAAWSSGGNTIAYAGSNDGSTSIYQMNAIDGGGRKALVSGSNLEVEPAFSPNGKLLAFASGRFGNPHIFVRDLVSSKDTRITYSGWYNSSPEWSPDGKQLCFAGFDKDIGRYEIFKVNADGSQTERLTTEQGDNENPTWSPDGEYIIFQSNRLPNGKGKLGAYKLYFMNKNGENQKEIEIPMYDVQMPSWSKNFGALDD